MKCLNALILALFAVSCGKAQSVLPPAPPWNATVKVVDETGQPVPSANVDVSYYVKPPPGQSEASEKISGLTDIDGIFKASHQDTRSITLGFYVTKSGYYPSRHGHDLYMAGQFDAKTVETSHNPNLTILLKKVAKPIPMYAKRLDTHIPVLDKPVGFDLMAGDWVAPYGKGMRTDIIFTAKLDKRSERDWDSKLTVSFPNQGDGIQPFTVSENEKVSDLRSPREAPESGYEAQWIKTRRERPDEPSKYGIDDKLNFFFRIRTILDDKGNVKSALYGKIYGDFMQFRYYFNPTPNDHNVEFDPKQNLMQGLKGTEEVSQP